MKALFGCLFLKLLCVFCETFTFDDQKGDVRAELPPGIEIQQISEQWRCPVCGHWKGNLKKIEDEEYGQKRASYEKNYPPIIGKPAENITYYRDIARRQLARVCAVNKVCDGDPDRLCQGMKYGKPIGFGGAGQGKTWSANFQALSQYKLKMRVIREHSEPKFETSFRKQNCLSRVGDKRQRDSPKHE